MIATHGKTKQPGGFMNARGIAAKQRHLAEFNLLKDIKVKCKECGKLMQRSTQDGKWYYFCGDCMRQVWIEMPKYLES
jgi:formamidopyrimidine-DNA glycosylase